jgi:WD40 repeat protein
MSKVPALVRRGSLILAALVLLAACAENKAEPPVITVVASPTIPVAGSAVEPSATLIARASSPPAPTQTTLPTATLAPTDTPTSPPPGPQPITPENASQVALLEVLGQGPLSGMALLPDGQTVVAAYQTGFYFYAVETLAGRGFVPAEGFKTSLVAYPGGRYLAVARGETVELWNLAAGEMVWRLEGSAHLVAFDPQGALMATVSSEMHAGKQETYVTLWDLSALPGGQVHELLSLGDIPGGVSSLAFAPDGRTLVTSGGQDYGDPDDRPLRLWDTSSGQPLPLPGDLAQAAAYLKNLAFSPDGQILAASDASRIYLWDVATGATRYVLGPHQGNVSALAFDAGGRYLASGTTDGGVYVWSLVDGALVNVPPQLSSEVLGLAFLPPDAASGGQMLVTATARDGIQVLDLSQAELIAAAGPQGPTKEVTALAYSPDGRLLAAASSDETIWLWDAAAGAPVKRLDAPRLAGNSSCACYWSLAFSPNGTILAAGSTDAVVRLWDVTSGDLLDVLEAPSDLVGSLAFSPSGDLLAAGDYDGNLWVWDLSSGLTALPTLRLENPPTVLSVSFSPDGRTLAAGSGFGTLRLWNVRTGELAREIDVAGSNASRAAFSPDGNLLVSIRSGFEPDYAVRLWDTETWGLLRTLEGHQTDVTDLAFSPDGSLLATSDQDGSVWLWDLTTGEALRTLEQGRWVTSVAFHPDGTRLATGGYDTLIRIWGVP